MLAKSESIKEITVALVKVQQALPCAKKDTANPFFKSKYADLHEIIHVSRELLVQNGIAVVQGGAVQGGMVGLSTLICHTSGEWIESFYPLTPTKNDPQSQGSAVTYARRYMHSAMIGVVAEEDDDGNAASAKPEPKKEPVAQLPSPVELKNELTACLTVEAVGALLKKYTKAINEVKKDNPTQAENIIAQFSLRKADILTGVAGPQVKSSGVVLDDSIPF